MANLSLRTRRLRAWIVLSWLVLALLLIVGVVVAFTASGIAGIILFGLGTVGFLGLGAVVFMYMPRRG